jgi:hypothetical protein
MPIVLRDIHWNKMFYTEPILCYRLPGSHFVHESEMTTIRLLQHVSNIGYEGQRVWFTLQDI